MRDVRDATRLPVLLVAFKRPETTRRVIEAIRRVRPPRVYFAVDGPRPGSPREAELVAEVRALVDSCFDWDCQVETFFREENRGCALGVSEAISFFFRHEEAGVILEDDCVPEPDFFRYCEVLLDRYRDDPRMMHISGNSRVRIEDPGSSYFLSRYPQVWGWASWRDAWNHFEFAPAEPDRELEVVLNRFADERERKYWEKILRRTFEGKIDSWAYRWAFAIWLADGVSAYPVQNLVRNVGFGSDSTHTGPLSASRWSMPEASPLNELRHPDPPTLRKDLDLMVFERAYAKAPLPIRAGRAMVSLVRNGRNG